MSNAETYFRYLVNEIHTTIVATVDDEMMFKGISKKSLDFIQVKEIIKKLINIKRIFNTNKAMVHKSGKWLIIDDFQTSGKGSALLAKMIVNAAKELF